MNITNEDNMKLMARYDDNHFDLAIVDPNYSETFNTDACVSNKGKKGNYKISNLNVKTPDEYFVELFRVSKNQIIWGANWYGKYFGVGGIVWDKQNTGNYSPCEYAYKSLNNHIDIFKFRWNGMLQGDMKNKEKRIHPTQKPVKLYEWLLMNYAKEGDKILDTHLGSGSIAIACHNLGFDLTACELDKEYYDAAMKRLHDHKLQQKLF
jgi:site-specific DNA-methyltransferase (adenine-specific)